MSIKASLGSLVSRCACCRAYIEYDNEVAYCDECLSLGCDKDDLDSRIDTYLDSRIDR